MSGSSLWKATLFRPHGGAQVWASTDGMSLFAAMVDWDRDEPGELRSLLSAAASAAAGGPPLFFARGCLTELHRRLTGESRPPGVNGVSAAAFAASSRQATVAWAGDVRVQVDGDAGPIWSSRDHTIANLALQSGIALPDDPEAKRRIYKAVGPVNALDLEEHTTEPARIRRIVLCTSDVHGFEPLDVERLISRHPRRLSPLPLDDLADWALLVSQ